ncbi:hypothetical protein INT48_001563 [Thamnidium elegans]|uniref:MULE transposase domain-containing protein n=1 Tax=Thamnidium elegans TaxID=101142 RepID=A0A8H7SPW3_9FUNG|nr:hypothetical protein INT48_001563 [Thamnidium elegans]
MSYPPVDENQILNKKCLRCEGIMIRIRREVQVKYFFSLKQLYCAMRHDNEGGKGIKHSYGPCFQKHLTQEELVKVDKMIKKNPSITTSHAIAGIANSRIFEHEIRKSRVRSGLSSPLSKNHFEEFAKIKEEFPGYIISAELASAKFCIIFSVPKMTKVKLPFDTQPMITGETYKAVCEGYYLCYTVIYVPEMKKHLVIFQAIVKKLDTNQFAVYFEALSKKFGIVPDTFRGMIMDFSFVQCEGFLKTFFSSFRLDKAHAMPFLKRYFMHWMQSVQKIVSNYTVVSPVTNVSVFVESGRKILSEFPCARRWIKWRLQLSIAQYNNITVAGLKRTYHIMVYIRGSTCLK